MRYIIEVLNGKLTTFKFAETLKSAKQLANTPNTKIFDKVKMKYVA